MKKIGVIVKETQEARIIKGTKDAQSVFVVKYSGLSSPDITTLRQALHASQAKLFVVKNTVARRALKSAGLDAMIKGIDGPCGIVFVNEEPVAASKILYNFSKDHDKLKLEGGALKDRILDKKDIETLAKLPSKEMLRAMAVGALKAPITGLVFVLKGNLRKLVICLNEIKNKKGSS